MQVKHNYIFCVHECVCVCVEEGEGGVDEQEIILVSTCAPLGCNVKFKI